MKIAKTNPRLIYSNKFINFGSYINVWYEDG